MFVDKCKGRSVRDRDNFVDNLGAHLPGRLMYSICYSILLYAISHIFIHHRSWLSLLTTGQTCLADKRVVEMFARDLPSKMIISNFFWVLIFFFIFTLPNIFIIIIDIIFRCCKALTKTNISVQIIFKISHIVSCFYDTTQSIL